MGFFFLLLILGSPVFGGLLYGFYVGARAFAASWGQHGPHMITLRFLALNLCEPLVNSVIVTMLLMRAGLGMPAALFCTAPMAVLLLPALGLGFADPFYRDQCRQILRRGMLRWGTNLVILLGCSGVPVLYVLAILAFLYSLFLLWQTILAGKAQLDVALSAPLPTLAPLPSPAHGPVARVPAPVLAPPRAPAPPLDPERAVRCALCQAPTAPDATGCPCCGLVFLSRVPAALQALGSYTVLRPLGGGGMSSVYLARSRADNALCVLKTLASVDQQLAAWRQEAGRCLRREAILLGQLDHPRVARLLDWSGDGQNDFLVLEYVAGPTLEQRLTRASAQGIVIPGGPLPLAEALAYGRSVADTLCYLSDLSQPVVHCDIKPANLIVPPADRDPVLVDFGGAVRVAGGAQATVQIDRYGTPGYSAPEQYAGASSPKSDVYGLAATLYHLLTDDDPSAHPLAFPALAGLPAESAGVLASALAHDPDARPDARRFSASLRELGASA